MRSMWVGKYTGLQCTVYIVLYCRMSMRSMWVGMYTGLQYTLGRVLVLLYSGNPCSRHQSQEYHSFIYPFIHPILSFIHLFVLSFIHLFIYASMRPSFLASMHSCIHPSILPYFFKHSFPFIFLIIPSYFFFVIHLFINFLYYFLLKMYPVTLQLGFNVRKQDPLTFSFHSWN